MELPDANDLPYWKTSQSSPENWVDKACLEIERAGGVVDLCMPSVRRGGRMAHIIGFSLDGDTFKLVWPVLGHDKRDRPSAIRQAATMMYHDVKSRCVTARVFGARWAFQAEMMLPDGRTAGQLSTPELIDVVPRVALLTHENEEGE